MYMANVHHVEEIFAQTFAMDSSYLLCPGHSDTSKCYVSKLVQWLAEYREPDWPAV